MEKPIKLQIAARCVGQISSTEADQSGGLRVWLTSAGGEQEPALKTSARFKKTTAILHSLKEKY